MQPMQPGQGYQSHPLKPVMTPTQPMPAGQMNPTPNFQGGPMQPASYNGVPDFSHEPPLLEEIGVNMKHIYLKTITVLNVRKKIDESIMDDADLAG
jgi:hypothetical protein